MCVYTLPTYSLKMFLRLFCFVSLTSIATLAWRWTSKWPSRDVVSSELVLSAGASLVMPGDEKYYDLTLMKSRDFTRTPGAIAVVRNKGNTSSNSAACL